MQINRETIIKVWDWFGDFCEKYLKANKEFQ